MQTFKTRCTWSNILSIFFMLLFVSCQEEAIIEPEESETIDATIIAKVVEATSDELLKPQLERELQYMVDREIASIESVEIYYNDLLDEYEYIVEGDIVFTREGVQNRMNSIQLREHRHVGSTNTVFGPDPGSYTIYVHSSVPSNWVNAITEAYEEYNDLNLNISFGGASTGSSSTIPGAIVVTMSSSLSSSIVAQATSPSYDGDIGRRIRINTSPSSSFQFNLGILRGLPRGAATAA